MSERNASSAESPVANGHVPAADAVPAQGHGLWWKLWLVLRVVQARLRFVAILAAVGGVIVYWDTLLAHYEKWTRPVLGQETAASPDLEYWCPMHPTIVRDHLDKCPICGMPLSGRKKGEAGEQEALPPGVISRVQLTPYRVAVAGIRTAEVGYQPLTKDITTVGTVEFDETRLARIIVRPTGKSRLDKLYVNVTGQTVRKGDPLALLYSPDLVVSVQTLLDARRDGNPAMEKMSRERLALWGIDDEQVREILRTGNGTTHLTLRSPISGHVIRKYQVEGASVDEGMPIYDLADLHTVWIEAQVYEDEVAFLKDGVEKKLPVVATTKTFPGREFKGEVAFLHPHMDAATRTLMVRFNMENPNHDLRPGMYAAVRLQVPVPRLDLFADRRAEKWRDQCAAEGVAHAVLDPTGLNGGSCVGALVGAGLRASLAQRGLVLAVPERAVIDTGSRKVVYREAEPELFEGVEVRLGPRSGGFYPVVDGLRPGDRVATSGSFLIDAETRLTAGVDSTYFGAGGGPQGVRHSAATSARLSMTKDQEDRDAGRPGEEMDP